MTSRRDWLDAGLAILAEHGAPALTIERLTGRMNRTKGSFYHHFGGMSGYKTALLGHFETECTTRYVEAVEADAAAAPRAKLERLLELVLAGDGGPKLEVAIRAWALQDPEVRAAQERLDRTRTGYLRSLCQDLTDDPELSAHLLYLVLVGAGHVIPPVPPATLRRIYDLVMGRGIVHSGRRGRSARTAPGRR